MKYLSQKHDADIKILWKVIQNLRFCAEFYDLSILHKRKYNI